MDGGLLLTGGTGLLSSAESSALCSAYRGQVTSDMACSLTPLFAQ